MMGQQVCSDDRSDSYVGDSSGGMVAGHGRSLAVAWQSWQGGSDRGGRAGEKVVVEVVVPVMGLFVEP